MDTFELNPGELEKVAGGSSMDLYRTMAALIDKIMWAAKNNGYRTACCPSCGAELKLLNVRYYTDEEMRLAESKKLKCRSCGSVSKDTSWIKNSYN
jgi:hypothetical protein